MFQEEVIEDDIFHLKLMTNRPDVWMKDYLQAQLRLLWIQSQMELAQGNTESGTMRLELVSTAKKLFQILKL